MFSKIFSGLIKRSKKEGEKGVSGVKKGEAKTTFYRSHYIKKHPDSEEIWGCKINGELVAGRLESVKKSINNWYETKVVVPPAHFEALPERPTDRQVVDYKGFKIINDNGGEKDWYVTHKGKLLKGSKSAIEKRIDLALERAQARKDAMVNKSIEMANNLDKTPEQESA